MLNNADYNPDDFEVKTFSKKKKNSPGLHRANQGSRKSLLERGKF